MEQHQTLDGRVEQLEQAIGELAAAPPLVLRSVEQALAVAKLAVETVERFVPSRPRRFRRHDDRDFASGEAPSGRESPQPRDVRFVLVGNLVALEQPADQLAGRADSCRNDDVTRGLARFIGPVG